jgi:hypothetical protein
MGATTFFVRARGKDAKTAFYTAVENARWECGNGGYTGTIAEKDSFTPIAVPSGVSPSDYAIQLVDEDDPRIVDKWGPAGCVATQEGEYLFFGWASC